MANSSPKRPITEEISQEELMFTNIHQRTVIPNENFGSLSLFLEKQRASSKAYFQTVIADNHPLKSLCEFCERMNTKDSRRIKDLLSPMLESLCMICGGRGHTNEDCLIQKNIRLELGESSAIQIWDICTSITKSVPY